MNLFIYMNELNTFEINSHLNYIGEIKVSEVCHCAELETFNFLLNKKQTALSL